MFCLRPGLTSEWSVFKKLCILLYASARRRGEEKSSASTILTREHVISLLFMPPKEGLYLHASLSFFPQLFSSLDVTG